MAAADALTDCGIMAWEAGDAQEALSALEQHPRIAVLFTDVNMPGPMDGLDLAQEVSASRPDVQVIVTSGARTVANEDLPDHGTFLAKPYRTQQLLSIVEEKLVAAG
jgi:DNA-binding NtrC family response regulator